MTTKTEEIRKKIKSLEKQIYSFNRGGDLFEAFNPVSNHPPKEEGLYLTIRCGLDGIYTKLDEWKNNSWQLGVLDASRVIAYSVNPINLDEYII